MEVRSRWCGGVGPWQRPAWPALPRPLAGSQPAQMMVVMMVEVPPGGGRQRPMARPPRPPPRRQTPTRWRPQGPPQRQTCRRSQRQLPPPPCGCSRRRHGRGMAVRIARGGARLLCRCGRHGLCPRLPRRGGLPRRGCVVDRCHVWCSVPRRVRCTGVGRRSCRTVHLHGEPLTVLPAHPTLKNCMPLQLFSWHVGKGEG